MSLTTRILSLITLFVYVFFSQFFVKAWVTTDFTLYSQEDFCFSKKLDTYDAKWDCWKKHTTADIFAVYDFSFGHSLAHILPVTLQLIAYEAVVPNLVHRYAQAPPGGESSRIFLNAYVGIILLLV